MGRRRRGGSSGVSEFFNGFNAAYNTVGKILADKEMRDISTAQQDPKTVITEKNAPDSEQFTYDSDTGQYVPSLKAIEAGQSEGVQPVQPAFDNKISNTFLGKTYDKTLTSGEENSARMMAMSGVLSKNGDPMGALRLRAASGELDADERKRADNDELRSVLAGGVSRLKDPNAEARSSIGSGADITGASNALGYTETSADTRSAVAQTQGVSQPRSTAQGGRQVDPLDDYLTRVAPKAVQTLVKQGRLNEAKAFSEFVDSEQGKTYATRWLAGVRKHSMGDSTGALEEFGRIYNSQLYSDGNTVRLSPLDDGKRYRIEQLDPDGKVLGSKDGDIATLADNAAAALSPTSAVSFHLKQQSERAKEGALLDRQIQLEKMRQDGRETAEAHRDARLVQTLESRERQRSAGGGLSLAQQRSNAEIDAAREAVSGLSPEDIRKRTAKTTDTGRENPDYDPGLARAASLAGRRKIGDDQLFDQRTQGQQQPQPAPTIDRKDVAGRFRADRQMDGYTLGKDTPKGVEVLKGGKIVGYYR